MQKILSFIYKLRILLNFPRNLKPIQRSILGNEQISQIILMNQYRLLSQLTPNKLPKLSEVGFELYSEFEEDGQLLYIFSLINFTNKRVIELCGGKGESGNITNLIINHGCHGLLIDGNPDLTRYSMNFFRQKNRAMELCPPICLTSWITKENVNTLLESNGFSGDIDLLSLDMDGVDYWIWKEIHIIRPRVFICEVQDIIPDDLSVTVPYKSDFSCSSKENFHEDFRSVSPLAMIKLCKEKGYRLIGSHRFGFNLIFLRNDVGNDFFPEVSLESISDNPWSTQGKKKRWPQVKDAPWVKV